jgi:hypothetical protein
MTHRFIIKTATGEAAGLLLEILIVCFFSITNGGHVGFLCQNDFELKTAFSGGWPC